MRNEKIYNKLSLKKGGISKNVIFLASTLPYFKIDFLKSLVKNEYYVKIILSRYSKSKEITRIKKGIYVTNSYLDKIKNENKFSDYLEFLASIIYNPSYLSLEYVLYEHNILTEIPVNFTLITKRKTKNFSGPLGNFIYHKVRDGLFTGFESKKSNEFIIYKATKVKALFDFLYLRKNLIMDEKSFYELRLNLNELNANDKIEIKKYVKMEGSKRMKMILEYVFKNKNY